MPPCCIYRQRVLGGNSHLLMMERNNLKVADLLIDWIEEN